MMMHVKILPNIVSMPVKYLANNGRGHNVYLPPATRNSGKVPAQDLFNQDLQASASHQKLHLAANASFSHCIFQPQCAAAICSYASGVKLGCVSMTSPATLYMKRPNLCLHVVPKPALWCLLRLLYPQMVVWMR